MAPFLVPAVERTKQTTLLSRRTCKHYPAKSWDEVIAPALASRAGNSDYPMIVPTEQQAVSPRRGPCAVKPLIFQGHAEVYKKSLPQMMQFSPRFLLALHRQ